MKAASGNISGMASNFQEKLAEDDEYYGAHVARHIRRLAHAVTRLEKRINELAGTPSLIGRPFEDDDFED